MVNVMMISRWETGGNRVIETLRDGKKYSTPQNGNIMLD